MIFDRFKDKLAILPLEGPIMEGQGPSIFPSFMQSSISRAEEYLDEINKNKRYKGLILEINSPGGSPYKSKRLAQKVEKLDLYKVARIKEQGTSGAYWIAAACDKIVADELSNVGSIGTISVRPDFSEFLKNLGIKMDIEEKGKFKGQGMPFSEISEEEKERRKEVLEEINEMFKDYIKRKRNVNEEGDVLEGKVFLGREAKNVGLIDYLGDRDKAIEVFEQETGMRDLTIKDFKKEIEKGPSILDLFR